MKRLATILAHHMALVPDAINRHANSHLAVIIKERTYQMTQWTLTNPTDAPVTSRLPATQGANDMPRLTTPTDAPVTSRLPATQGANDMPRLTTEVQMLVDTLQALEYWFDTDDQILAAMDNDTLADHNRQVAKIKSALAPFKETK
jgi:hypothetical protein